MMIRNKHAGTAQEIGIYNNLIRNRMPLGSLREKVRQLSVSYPDFLRRTAVGSG
jgi:hypothetical protein